jgi:hypothetical protein
MGLFDSLVNLVGDVATVVTKPVEVVVDLADAAVKPLADGMTELAKDVKDLLK